MSEFTRIRIFTHFKLFVLEGQINLDETILLIRSVQYRLVSVYSEYELHINHFPSSLFIFNGYFAPDIDIEDANNKIKCIFL